MFHSCENGTRKVTYEWRKDTICDIAKATLPSDRMIECSKCPVGSFLSDKKTGRCDPCPHGYYSSSENAETCAVCPPGKYTPLKEAYAGLESMPLEMETFCESTSPYTVDLCAFTAGWIVSNGVLTTPPHAPAGARFVMRKKLSVMQHQGKLEFTYIARGNQAQERFKIRIDNRITELQPSQVARTERFDLVPGFHVIDWIAERVSEDPAIVPLEIVSILTEGSTGSSDTCLACPTVSAILTPGA